MCVVGFRGETRGVNKQGWAAPTVLDPGTRTCANLGHPYGFVARELYLRWLLRCTGVKADLVCPLHKFFPQPWVGYLVKAFEKSRFRPTYADANMGHPYGFVGREPYLRWLLRCTGVTAQVR
jgi:hypothetical protein